MGIFIATAKTIIYSNTNTIKKNQFKSNRRCRCTTIFLTTNTIVTQVTTRSSLSVHWAIIAIVRVIHSRFFHIIQCQSSKTCFIFPFLQAVAPMVPRTLTIDTPLLSIMVPSHIKQVVDLEDCHSGWLARLLSNELCPSICYASFTILWYCNNKQYIYKSSSELFGHLSCSR